MITLPRAESGDDIPQTWVGFSIGLFEHSGSQGLRESFVIRHDPNQLFGILGYHFALAIHDNIFATEFRDVEEVSRIEIPPHMNDVKFKVKETKLSLPILRQPARLSNESRDSTVMGLLGNYSEPNVGYLSVSILGSNHSEGIFSQTAMPAGSATVPFQRTEMGHNFYSASSTFAAAQSLLFSSTTKRYRSCTRFLHLLPIIFLKKITAYEEKRRNRGDEVGHAQYQRHICPAYRFIQKS